MKIYFQKMLLLFTIIISAFEYSNAQTYCSPTFSSGCVSNNYISYVSVGGMTNSATGCATSNYLSKIANMNAGDTISMTVTCAGWDGISVFVDLNNDGDFTDTLELLYKFYKAPTPPITYTFDITIPINTAPGNHRFRVFCGNGGSGVTTNPCANISWGSFHDYTLKVKNDCPVDSNLTISNQKDSAADFSWAPRTGVLGYEYHIDTLSTPPSSGTFTNGTTYHASNLIKGKTYYFFIRSSCTAGAYSPWGVLSFVACYLPEAEISEMGNIGHCKGDTTMLSVLNFDTINTYQWYRNSKTLPGKVGSSIIVTTLAGKYYYKVESMPGCQATSEFAQVSIYNIPTDTAELTLNGHLLVSGGFSTYKWLLNGTPIVGATDSTYLALANGTYIVYGYDTNGCTAGYSNSINVKTVGIENISSENGLLIYPNPVKDQLVIKSTEDYGMINVGIYNLDGKEVYTQNKRFSNEVLELDLSGLNSGIYFIKISNGDILINQKIVKE